MSKKINPNSNSSSDEKRIIEVDPLKATTRDLLGGSYETTRHTINLFTPGFPIHKHGDFIFLGNSELTSSKSHLPFFEVHAKREWLVSWCENKIHNKGGWYLLEEIAKLLLEELNQGNSHIHFFELVKQYHFAKLEKDLERYITPREYEFDGKKYTIDANDIIDQYYTGSGNLREHEIIKDSIKVKRTIFCDLLQEGEIVIRDHKDGSLNNVEKIEYYGSGRQVGPLAGGGGIHFLYDGIEIAYINTWMS